MEIIIIGAGLAGLTAAIALSKAGHRVQILESANNILYIGAGIQISPNSSRILRKLGVDRFIERYCVEPIDLRMMRWKTGEVLVQVPLKGGCGTEGENGSPYWHIHRADLHRGLVDAAREAGCEVFLESRVVSIDTDDAKPSLTTASGKVFEADLIVASDGLHSLAREVVAEGKGEPIPTGQMAYRVTLPAKVLEDVEGLEEIISVPRNNHWLGPWGTVLSYVLEGGDRGRLVNFVFTCDAEGFMPDGVDQRPGDLETVRKRFADWDPRIGRMLGFVGVGSVLEWRLFTHATLPSWVHPSGKLCLIGDAAHAMTPYLAQGAAMGIEDAAILGGLLSKFPSSSPVDPKLLRETLLVYEKLRKKRASIVAKESVESRWFTQMEDGPGQQERDEYLLAHPGIQNGHRNVRSQREFLEWLFGWDAYEVLEEYLNMSEI